MLTTCFVFFSSGFPRQDLFAVVNEGQLYKRYPPQNATDNWLATAQLIGGAGWAYFQHLFFHPDGTLYGVWWDTIVKGPPPTSPSQYWQPTIVGRGGWQIFQFLFFHPNGDLYGVTGGKLYRRSPPQHIHDNWHGNAELVGAGGWQVFKFLFFDPQGILYGVENGNLHKRVPPIHAFDNWLRSSTLIGTDEWSDFQHLFFMADGQLYGVHHFMFYKRFPPAHQFDHWLETALLIGTDGWSSFKFLLAPLKWDTVVSLTKKSSLVETVVIQKDYYWLLPTVGLQFRVEREITSCKGRWMKSFSSFGWLRFRNKGEMKSHFSHVVFHFWLSFHFISVFLSFGPFFPNSKSKNALSYSQTEMGQYQKTGTCFILENLLQLIASYGKL